jgi:hypothetical protein
MLSAIPAPCMQVAHWAQEKQTVSIIVQCKWLGDSKETLGAYFRQVTPPTPERTITLLMMLFTLLSEPSLCDIPGSVTMPDDNASQAEEDNEPEGDAAAGKKKKKAKNAPANNNPWFDTVAGEQGKCTIPRISLYHEQLRSDEADIIVGHHFYFQVNDPGLDLNRGIINLVARNATQAEADDKYRKAGQNIMPLSAPLALVQSVTSIAQFINILGGHLEVNPPDEAKGKPLFHRDNPARLHSVFDHEHFRERLPDGCTHSMMYGIFPIEGSARHLLPEHFHPNIMFNLRLFETETSQAWCHGLGEAEIHATLTRMLEMCAADPGSLIEFSDEEAKAKDGHMRKDLMDHVRWLNEAQLSTLQTQDEKEALCRSPLLMERFMQLLSPKADISPAKANIFEYYRKLRRTSEIKGQPYFASPLKTITEFADPSLDLFANLMIRFIDNIENMSISHMHEEILLLHLCTLSCLKNEFKSKLNIALTGKFAAGKSHAMDTALLMMIAGSYTKLSRTTKGANNSTADQCGLSIIRDEMPDAFFTSETGESEIKEEMTTCMRITQYLDMTGGMRLQRTIMGKFQNMNGFATNRNASAIPGPLRSRLIIRTVVDHAPRDGHGFFDHMTREACMERVLDDPRRKQKKAFLEECMFIQFLILVVECMIYVRMLPDVDLSVAAYSGKEWCACLAASGIEVNQRTQDTFTKACRMLTIDYAVRIVFQTNVVFPPTEEPRPFEVADVMKVQPFLFCTEQIAMYTFTQLNELFVQPFVDQVVRVIATALCNYPGARQANTRFGLLAGGGVDATEDYDFLGPAVHVSSAGVSQQTKLGVLAEATMKYLDSELKISIESVVDILLHLTQQKYKCNKFDPKEGNGQTGEDWEPAVLEISSFPCKFRLLRAFVDECFTRQDADPVKAAVTKSFHSFTPDQRYILGTTMRTRRSEFFPELFEVVQGAPNPHLVRQIRNPYPDPEFTHIDIQSPLDDVLYNDYVALHTPVPDSYWPSALAVYPFEVQGGKGHESYPSARMEKARVVNLGTLVLTAPLNEKTEALKKARADIKRRRLEEQEKE